MLGSSTARKAQPQYRRALGELTNSPLLLSPGATGLSPRAPHPSPRLARDEGGLSTPPKGGPASSPDTITPTHNLKLLTELASKMPGAVSSSSARQTLQFEDLEPSRTKGRSLLLGEEESESPHKDHSYLPRATVPLASQFREHLTPRSNPIQPPTSRPAANVSPCPPPSTSERGNRKDKSLGILAERMLASLPYAMSAGESTELQLDDTARALHTERRRIYDIVNVFEAVQIMSKVGKNVYQWHGRTYLVSSLAWLRQLATKLGVLEQYNIVKEQEMQTMIHNQENVNIENVSPGWANSPSFSPLATNSPLNSPYNSPNDPNGTSMGINTQKFLMLFLVSPQPQTLTLDFAAKVIHGIHQVEKTRLTRVRRLYDIANILQSLGLIRKVSLTDGRGKKPAYQYIGPDVSTIELSEDEKRGMPATRQKNSLLAVGRSLSLTEAPPSPGTTSAIKRARSLSEERQADGPTSKLTRARSETRVDTVGISKATQNRADLPGWSQGSKSRMDTGVQAESNQNSQVETDGSSLLDLGEVCGVERERLDEPGQGQVLMKPPTPGRPPSRKKHLLQRYYSDSALLSTSMPVPKANTPHTFTSPKPVSISLVPPTFNNHTSSPVHGQGSPGGPARALSLHAVPQRTNAVPQSPRTNYSPLHPSPLTKPTVQPPVSPRVRTPMRSPITPRDLRNSSILPPNSPTGRSKMITCSPMGPVGRSLLSSPASPRAPIDLTVRQQRPQGRSPLASRALHLPPSPHQQVPSTPPSTTIRVAAQEKSPLLRAYLATSKTKSFFTPINSPSHLTLEEGVSVLPPDMNDTASNGSTTLSLLSNSPSPPTNSTSPDGSTTSSSASSSTSELESILGGKLPTPRAPPTRPKQVETPLDFSGLLPLQGPSLPDQRGQSLQDHRGPSLRDLQTPRSFCTPQPPSHTN